jgi:peptide/nickel transport system permease protein
VRTSTQVASRSGYVEAAVARGERAWSIAVREIVPNIAPVVLADVGLRFGFSILLIASMNYLGLGLEPPASDWGLMLAENRLVIAGNPWSCIAPAICLGLLMIGVNLIGDAYAQLLGRSSRALRTAVNRQRIDTVTSADPVVAPPQ